MLRGFATVNYYADDLEAAAAWYTAVLGVEPYFRIPGGYIEFRIGDYQHELGIVDVCVFPFLKYAVLDPAADDDERFHAILADLLRADEHPLLDDWVRRVDAHPRA